MPSLCSLAVAFASVVCPFVSPSTSGSRPGGVIPPRIPCPVHTNSKSLRHEIREWWWGTGISLRSTVESRPRFCPRRRWSVGFVPGRGRT